MYELVYILFYYCILLSLLHCYKRYISPVTMPAAYQQQTVNQSLGEDQQSRVEYEYTQIELISEKGDKE